MAVYSISSIEVKNWEIYEEYMKKTKPVLDFYSSKSYFYEIDGSQKIQEITDKIEQILTV